MARPHNSKKNWVDALPGDWPENQPKVHLYRLDAQHRWRYLGVFPARYFDLAFVKYQFGGGEYWYRAIKKGRSCRSDGFLIEGTPKPVPESRAVREPSFRNRR